MGGEVKATNAELAYQDYLNGMKYKEIAEKYGVTINTVKSWKTRYKWSKEGEKSVHTKKKKVCTQKSRLGNQNAAGHGAPEGNKNAEKYGFFSKFLPDETREIFSAIEEADPLDLLWHQIQLAYAAIIRAQKIAYVKDQKDKTVEKVEEKKGKIMGEKWEVQQAWDKQNEFLKAQARAQGELRSLIKQYDEMLHKNWDMATEEQRIRVRRAEFAMNQELGNHDEDNENITSFLKAMNPTQEDIDNLFSKKEEQDAEEKEKTSEI